MMTVIGLTLVVLGGGTVVAGFIRRALDERKRKNEHDPQTPDPSERSHRNITN